MDTSSSFQEFVEWYECSSKLVNFTNLHIDDLPFILLDSNARDLFEKIQYLYFSSPKEKRKKYNFTVLLEMIISSQTDPHATGKESMIDIAIMLLENGVELFHSSYIGNLISGNNLHYIEKLKKLVNLLTKTDARLFISNYMYIGDVERVKNYMNESKKCCFDLLNAIVYADNIDLLKLALPLYKSENHHEFITKKLYQIYLSFNIENNRSIDQFAFLLNEFYEDSRNNLLENMKDCQKTMIDLLTYTNWFYFDDTKKLDLILSKKPNIFISFAPKSSNHNYSYYEEPNKLLRNIAISSNIRLLKKIINSGYDIKKILRTPYCFGDTFLFTNIRLGRDPEFLEYILNLDSDIVNEKDGYGNTPLMVAINKFGKPTEIIEILIKYGADPYITCNSGKNSFDFAKKTRYEEEIVEMLECLGGAHVKAAFSNNY